MNLEYSGKHTILVGPWGGQDGYHWDDGVYSTIRQIEIAHGAGIDSISIEYDINGKSIWSEKHGGAGGSKIDKVRLEYPDEYLTSLHGHYGSVQEWGPILIRSLTFETNKRTFGPFGTKQGTYFTFPKTPCKIVGFIGKSGWYLDAIGAYVEPLDHHKPINPPGPIYRAHQNVAQHVTEKYEYSMIQQSLGTNYDLIVAVRQKNDPHHHLQNTSQHINSPLSVATHISHDHHLSHIDKPKNEIAGKIERESSTKIKGIVSSGPWGGSGGTLFDDGVYDGIRQINISRNLYIVSIRVCYEQNGVPVWGSKNGGTGSFKSDKIAFDYPSEILTHLTGYIGPAMIMGPNVIKSLTLHTTKGKYGPYGEEQGEFFSTKLKEGSMVVGFHGRKGLFLDAIGVHVLEGNVHVPPSSTSDKKEVSLSKINNQLTPIPTGKVDGNNSSEWPFKVGKRGQTHDEVVQRMVKDPAPYGPGPWGGEGGKPWDDGVFTGIKQILLMRTDAICCIEIEYDRNGQSVWSVKHGSRGGQTENRVKLDYPHEVLTCITGYYGPIKKDQGMTKVIQSLTFHTSRKKYGPYGEEIGTYFSSGTTEGKVVGFHGRSSMYLDAIGVHMQHWLGHQKWPKPPSLMKMFS